MLKAWIDFIVSVLKAIFKLKGSSSQEHQQHLQEHQQHLQDEYNKIDSQNHQNQSNSNPSLQEVGDKLNDRF